MLKNRRGSRRLARRNTDPTSVLRAVVRWYFTDVYRRYEGPGIVPFYCDPLRVRHLAVPPKQLAMGNARALFRLFTALGMYQSRRDVLIMEQQFRLSYRSVATISSPTTLERNIRSNSCRHLTAPEHFDRGCSVLKLAGAIDCTARPDAQCHVKEAAALFNRTAAFGKLPTSAWLHVWRHGGLATLLRDVVRAESDARRRAALLVDYFSRVRCVGRKLATMFVSALSVPVLAPGLTPWFPSIDGNELVVVDTNVTQAVDSLRGTTSPGTYDARAAWVREYAREIDLTAFGSDLPRYSPRIVQQALYAFRSKSNRIARNDDCFQRKRPCTNCAPALCPFATA